MTHHRQVPRHKVFISYHHDDQIYRDQFVQRLGHSIVDKSVEDGDIDDTHSATETVRQRIRDEFIRDATVTVVLIGPCTWQRKHVDWEIGSSLRDTPMNSRCGLLGILLPNHPDGRRRPSRYELSLIPPRLADNCKGNVPFAKIYRWPNRQGFPQIRDWIHTAFERRRQNPPPVNNRPQFGRNRSGRCSDGWKD